MKQTVLGVFFILVLLLSHTANSAVDDHVKNLLISVLAKLNGTTGLPDPSFGWNHTTDPCLDGWEGVTCDGDSVTKIELIRADLSGVLDAGALCNTQPLAAFLTIINIQYNNIGGQLPTEIGNCKNLSLLVIGNNKFSGSLPGTLPMLKNLKRLDVSNNMFIGELPDLSQISGLRVFLADHNRFTGKIPNFDFPNFDRFNVSFNNLSGPILITNGGYNESNFMDNPLLCGPPLRTLCMASENGSLSTPSGQKKPEGASKEDVLMYSGYAILAFFVFTLVAVKVYKRRKEEEKGETVNKILSVDDSMNYLSGVSGEHEVRANMSDPSGTSAESARASSSLIVLTSPVVNGLNFDNLLSAPAELLGRGKHGSLYMVMLEEGEKLAVKRIKDWAISRDEFKQRMQRIYEVKHPNVLTPLAFYCSNQEKLLVYEFLQNGSLPRFIHGSQLGREFGWASRLSAAATIAEAIAYMHRELHKDGIAHGNLKSPNILLNDKMEACISEYGLKAIDNQESSIAANVIQRPVISSSNAFQADIYGFGQILLELLTGKLTQTNGMDLATWVQAVVREEWTAEVFDKSLILEGASEERMVNLLRVGIKCVNQSPGERPTMRQVAQMINALKDEEERSVATES
ncbi:hypothetical protein K2173_013958 [Erythroxylum novogranatense]|uniref:Protein kinase domain-containing protein n=1 Tax=Erythroxylum novogranatense TaxID=1862640 RepID=A0AAV8SCY3_9ROSI|nr:hypothetical protein K2173_013958 [Erythroxylum novogranatense]